MTDSRRAPDRTQKTAVQVPLDLDGVIADLQKGEAVWAGLSLRTRRELLGDVLEAAQN